MKNATYSAIIAEFSACKNLFTGIIAIFEHTYIYLYIYNIRSSGMGGVDEKLESGVGGKGKKQGGWTHHVTASRHATVNNNLAQHAKFKWPEACPVCPAQL